MVTATVGRNEPCPCGSGKKFKRCCGAVLSAVPALPKAESLSSRLMDALIRNGRDEIEQSQLVFAERVADALGDGPAAYMSHEFLADLTASETNDTAIMTFALFDLFEDDGSSFAERYVRRERKTMSAADRDMPRE